jgi:pimeloyl-ACP methyl ester carboxylesterase
MKNFIQTNFKKLLFLVVGLTIIIDYFIFRRKAIGLEVGSRIEMFFLSALLLIGIGTIIVVLITLIGLMFAKERNLRKKKLGNQMIFLLIIIVLLTSFVFGSQLTAHTPKILGDDGQPKPGSIATMEKVRLGGVDQWIILRAHDVNKPVLILLSGGPGGSEAARFIRFNAELEKHFVVVIWEQRGCGKSYPSINPKSAMTVDQYTTDLLELTNLMRERFDEEKVYVLGHSWGSIIGVNAVQQRPDLFHAYIGTAQMVDVQETDQKIYDLVMEHARQTGDTQFVRTLERQGMPPYYGKSPIKPYSTLFGREYSVFEYPNIKNEAYRKDGDILLLMLKQPEYGWLDRVYYLLGLMNTFNIVYPQLQARDFRVDGTNFEVPVYMMLGRNDMNNPYQIPEEYFEMIDAPQKQLYFFEESGHGMIWEEADLFHDLMINTILPETYQQ